MVHFKLKDSKLLPDVYICVDTIIIIIIYFFIKNKLLFSSISTFTTVYLKRYLHEWRFLRDWLQTTRSTECFPIDFRTGNFPIVQRVLEAGGRVNGAADMGEMRGNKLVSSENNYVAEKSWNSHMNTSISHELIEI